MSVKSSERDKKYHLKMNFSNKMQTPAKYIVPAEELQSRNDKRFRGMSPPPGINNRIESLRKKGFIKRTKSAPSLFSHSDEMERKWLRQNETEELHALIGRAIDELDIISNTIEYLKESIRNHENSLSTCTNIANLLSKLSQDRLLILEDVEVEELRVTELQQKLSTRTLNSDERIASLTKAMLAHSKEITDDLWHKIRQQLLETKRLRSLKHEEGKLVEKQREDIINVKHCCTIIQEKIDMELQAQVVMNKDTLKLKEVVQKQRAARSIALKELDTVETQVGKEVEERNSSNDQLSKQISKVREKLKWYTESVTAVEKRISGTQERTNSAQVLLNECEKFVETKLENKINLQESLEETIQNIVRNKNLNSDNLYKIENINTSIKVSQTQGDQRHKSESNKLKISMQTLKMSLGYNKDLKVNCRKLEEQIEEWNKKEEKDRVSINALQNKLQRMERNLLSQSEECVRLTTTHQTILAEADEEHQAHLNRESVLKKNIDTLQRRFKEEQAERQRCRDRANREEESRQKKVKSLKVSKTRAIHTLDAVIATKEDQYAALQEKIKLLTEKMNTKSSLEEEIKKRNIEFDKQIGEINADITALTGNRMKIETEIEDKMAKVTSSEQRRRAMENAVSQKTEAIATLRDMLNNTTSVLEQLVEENSNIEQKLGKASLKYNEMTAVWSALEDETTERNDRERSEMTHLQDYLDKTSSDLIDAEILCKDLRVDISLMEYDNIKLKNILNDGMDARVGLELKLKDEKELLRKEYYTSKDLQVTFQQRTVRNQRHLQSFRLQSNQNTTKMSTISHGLRNELKTIDRFMQRVVQD